MTTHLSPQEFIDAVDGALASDRAEHLEGCDACRGEVVALQTAVRDAVSGADLPEPSPLFWNHFSERVRAATRVEPLPAGRHGWFTGWRAVLAMGTMAAAVAVAVTLQVRRPQVAPASPSAVVSENVPAVADDGSWDVMVLLASDLSADDLHGMAGPRPGAADALTSNLTVEQRKELVRLLKAEMGGTE